MNLATLLPLYSWVRDLCSFFSLGCWMGPLQCCQHSKAFLKWYKNISKLDALPSTTNNFCGIRAPKFMTSLAPRSTKFLKYVSLTVSKFSVNYALNLYNLETETHYLIKNAINRSLLPEKINYVHV